MTHHGWRKPTPDPELAEKLAQAGEQVTISKNRAFLAIKRIAAHIGLKPADVMLLDTFGAFTMPQDWEKGRRAIIWPSNACLIEQTGFSLSALKRHARRLAEAGLITFRDSPNGKRWGRRDRDGHITEAYGFDLSPLAARAGEFEMLFTEVQAERQLYAQLKRQITIARRNIRARLEILPAELTEDISPRFQALLAQLPRRKTNSAILKTLLHGFEALQREIGDTEKKQTDNNVPVDNSCLHQEDAPQKTRKPNPWTHKNEPHIQTTKELESVKEPEPVRLGSIINTCTEFNRITVDLGGRLQDWNDLHRTASRVRPMIGVQEHSWLKAQRRLGTRMAAAAMALVFEKFSAGKIRSPGAYLQALVNRAGAGELYLEKSFRGAGMRSLRAINEASGSRTL